jgi:hypothetical protein
MEGCFRKTIEKTLARNHGPRSPGLRKHAGNRIVSRPPIKRRHGREWQALGHGDWKVGSHAGQGMAAQKTVQQAARLEEHGDGKTKC